MEKIKFLKIQITILMIIFFYFFCKDYNTSAQICIDWKRQTTHLVAIASTSNNPDDYSWNEETNIMQGVIIDIIPSERVPVYIQQNNHIICFSTYYSLHVILNLEVNINNSGYTTIQTGSAQQVVWYDSESYFNTSGVHNLKVKYLVMSTYYYREYDIYVIPASQKLYIDNYNNTIRAWQGNNPGNNIPVVFSEGFDAYDITTQEFYYYAAQDIFECFRNNGYTIYFLDNKFGTQSIRNNAAGFDAAVRYVSSINSNQQVIAGGVSMGGLISRYALAKAENDGNPLPVSKFVSIDSPQQGAVISKKVQDYKKEHQEGDAFMEHALNNDAAKQMLDNYSAYDTSGSIHDAFYAELNALNGDGYPHLTENIGVAFSNNKPNPYSGTWLEIVYEDWYGGGLSEDFDLEPEEKVAGSYLPEDLTAMSPVIMRAMNWKWNITGIGILFNYPFVSVNRYKDPAFIPYNSALDIVSGESKFDITIETSETTHHDIFPKDIINPLVNAVIYDKDKFLQNETVTDTRDYIALETITAGRNVTSLLPVGDFIIENGANVNFIAGKEITLEPGFESGPNFETFITEIDFVDCGFGFKSLNIPENNTNLDNNFDYNLKNDTIYVKTNNYIDIKIYPNPNYGNFVIALSGINENLLSIEITNIMGSIVYKKQNIQSNPLNINISTHPKGIYFVKAFLSDKVFVEKIIYQ